MKVLNQAETALVLSDLLNGKAEITYARADDHEGKQRIYCTVRVSDSLKAFAHLFPSPLSSTERGDDDCSCGGGDISGHDALCPYAVTPEDQGGAST